jgi:NAD(P)-dependent dehydrogenase (short-subunit alcohol dehydrogenase family)
MPNILISGAASGFGLAFLTSHACDSSNTIIAIDRSKIAIPSRSNAKIKTYQVDVTLTSSISNLVASLKDVPIDIFIHSVGVRGLVSLAEAQYPNDVAAAEILEVMDGSTMINAYKINTVGTFSIIQATIPNLRLASECGAPAKAVIMGSRMGSINYNTAGSAYAYRASKAALNAVIKSFSIDVPDVIFTILHPGRVKTGLVTYKEDGAIDAEESVKDMIKVIAKLKRSDSGKFYDRFGDLIGW